MHDAARQREAALLVSASRLCGGRATATATCGLVRPLNQYRVTKMGSSDEKSRGRRPSNGREPKLERAAGRLDRAKVKEHMFESFEVKVTNESN